MRSNRRIVTSSDADGRSGVMLDGNATKTITVLTEMWLTDDKPAGPPRRRRPCRTLHTTGASARRHLVPLPRNRPGGQTAHLV